MGSTEAVIDLAEVHLGYIHFCQPPVLHSVPSWLTAHQVMMVDTERIVFKKPQKVVVGI